MKCIILAGGRGTRISEETLVRPKPLIEIGGRPILWHIMKIYAAHGVADFVICLGYKGYLIKEYFVNYYMHQSDLTVDLRTNSLRIHDTSTEPWVVTLVDTGEETLTGGRLKRVERFVGDEPFCFTYGDGVSDVDIGKLVAYHNDVGGIATMTAVQPPGRFGAVKIEDQLVTRFQEKPIGDSAWVNGGFFVLNPDIFQYLEGDGTSFEGRPLEILAESGKLAAYPHPGFWHSMDTLRDKTMLEAMWAEGNAAWKVWQ